MSLASHVSLPNQTVNPGASVVIPIVFAFQSDFVSGLQFDLQYDESVIALGTTAGEAVRNSEKRLYVAGLAPGRRRFLMVGFNRTLLSDGVVVNLFLNLNATAAGGVYELRLSNVVAVSPDGNSIPVTAEDGAVIVQGMAGEGSRLAPQNVLSAASLLPGAVSAGEIVTLIGAGIGPALPQRPQGTSVTALSGTSVFFDQVAAPLLYADFNQINAIVPYALSKSTATQLRVTSQGQVIADLMVPVQISTPAIFTIDASGIGPGAILNQDSTVNSAINAAAKGSVVSIFATGAGQTDPPSVDGEVSSGPNLPKVSFPVIVQIGGVEAQVLYAGAAPELVAGVIQVNCLVPADAPSGETVPVVLKIGTSSSQPGVSLAIE
jgi:uncharacterized protein (TIGR03437 family)